MKNTYIVIGVVVIVAILAFVLGSKKTVAPTTNNTNGDTYSVSDGTYKIDTTKSSIKWSGEYNKSSEDGSMAFSSGSLMVAAGAPSDLSYDIDLNSITDSSGNTVFVNYLKATTALNVDAYPDATFKINKIIANPTTGTSTGKYIIDGWLTIKNVTNDISFPATVSQNGNVVTLDSYFALNLKDWGVNAENLVGNSLVLEMHIEASR